MAAAAVALAVVLSMAAYALLGSRRDADATRRSSHFLMGGGDFFVHWFMWLVGPFERAALALGWSPIVFNFIGLAFGAAAGVLLAFGHFVSGAWMIFACGLCDILDGRVARARQVTSTQGAFVDSSLDRFCEVFVFLGLVWFFHDRPAGAFAASAALAGSLLVSYTRARGESLGVLCKEGLMQRAERLVLMWLAGALDGAFSRWTGHGPGTLMLWVNALIAAATFPTAIHRTWWIAARLKPPPTSSSSS
jgi:CDP-diacylglycerol--glycerol-3-phosphate 3-phosphatidyltransferase